MKGRRAADDEVREMVMAGFVCVEVRVMRGPPNGFYHDSDGKPSKDSKQKSDMICLMT